jgi:hypothetical protein
MGDQPPVANRLEFVPVATEVIETNIGKGREMVLSVQRQLVSGQAQ